MDTRAVTAFSVGGGEPHETLPQFHVQAIAMPVHGESQLVPLAVRRG